jgi:hypothetical protein
MCCKRPSARNVPTGKSPNSPTNRRRAAQHLLTGRSHPAQLLRGRASHDCSQVEKKDYELTPEYGSFFLGPNRAVLPEPTDEANLQSEARNAKNAPESAICGVLRERSATIGSVLWLVPISFPRSAPRRQAGPIYRLTPCEKAQTRLQERIQAITKSQPGCLDLLHVERTAENAENPKRNRRMGKRVRSPGR